jgi:hypothetical protein
MKFIKYYLYLTVALATTACHDLLDTDPTDFYSQDTFWQTGKHAQEALTASYQALTHAELYNAQTPFMFEAMSPNAFNYDNQRLANDFARGVQSETSLGMNSAMWSGCYRGIGRCNMVLDNVPGIEMDETEKSVILAQAKFLRAFYYNRINELFNGVPLITAAPDPATQSDLPRNSYEEVLAQILKDLDEAAEVLPQEYSGSNIGRATKGAALALKARVLLQNHRYQEVVATTEEIFALQQYELFSNYNGIFRKANQGNSEIIFDIRFKAPEVQNSYDIIMAQYSTQAPLQDLVDEYRMIDGQSIGTSDLYDPAKPYENRDPRFGQSIVYIGAPWRNRTATATDLHQTGYTFRKFTEYTETTVGTITNSDCNYVEIRYADVLLMFAEASNELSGPSDKVYEAINAIRTRPSVEMPELPQGLSQEEMRAAIRLERRIELAGEGSYFFDIRRWKTIEQEMVGPIHNYKNEVIQSRDFDPARDYYWPIPYTEIDLNPVLEQNPNY